MKALVLLPVLVVGFAVQAQTRSWTLAEVTRIGSQDGPNALTAVNDLILSPDGRSVYVTQRQDNTIRVFDVASGRLTARIGRAGAGPGEFQGLTSIGWKQDTLYAVDLSLRRVSLFTKEGKHLRTSTVVSGRLPETQTTASATAYLPNGTFIGSPQLPSMQVTNGMISFAPWVQMTQDGSIVRTVARRDVRGTTAQAAAGDRVVIFPQPMSQRTLLRVAPNGTSIAIIDQLAATDPTSTFRVTRIAPDGDTLYSRSYSYSPRPVPPGVADDIYEGLTRLFAHLGTGRAREAVRESVQLPARQPPISEAEVLSDGSVWLRREELGGSTVSWLVLEPDGRIRGAVVAPVRFQVRDIGRNNMVWGRIEDDLGVPYVVGYRLEPRVAVR